MTPSSVLVLGAGELGMAMLEALAHHPVRQQHQHQIKLAVLLRQATLDSAAPAKKKTVQRIRGLGIYLEGGDVTIMSTEDLAALFNKYDTVISCTGMGLPPGTQIKLVDAALQSKVKRYFPWQFGMDYDIIGEGSSQDLFDEQLEVRKRLRGQSQTTWTIVSTGLFMSFLFIPEFGVVDLERRTVRALGAWDNRITVTTPSDIGRVTADVVLNPGEELETGGHVVYVAGETVTYEQVADLLDEQTGQKFHRELWDKEELRRQMAEDPNTMVKYRDTFAQGQGVAWEIEKTANHQRDIAMTDAKTYIKMEIAAKVIEGEPAAQT